MRWMMGVVVGAVGLCGLACAGLGIGPGATVASSPVIVGQTTSFSYVMPADGDLGLWMTYDLSRGGASVGAGGMKASYTAGEMVVSGPITVTINGAPNLSETLSFGEEGGVFVSNSTRVTWEQKSSQLGGTKSQSGRTYLHSMKAVPAGATVVVTVDAAVSPSTTVNGLSLELTQ